jgi:hypothetical protein
MLLNFGLPQKAPNIVSAPKTNVDVDAILGLTPSSQYSGFKGVGDTGYYYKDNMMYEPYTVQPASSYFYRSSPYGNQYYSNYSPYGISSTPSYSPIFGYSGGWQRGSSGGAEEGTIYSGEQAFRPIKDANIKGFTYNTDAETYDPSMAYVYANAPKYQGVNLQTQTPVINLTAPTAMNFSGNSGAGRFLGGTDGLLGAMPLSFGLPSGESANG